MSDATVIELHPGLGLGIDTSVSHTQAAPDGPTSIDEPLPSGIYTPAATPVLELSSMKAPKDDDDERVMKRRKKRREKERDETQTEKEARDGELCELHPTAANREREKEREGERRRHRGTAPPLEPALPRFRASRHDQENDLDRDRERRRRKKVLRQASGHAMKPEELVPENEADCRDLVVTPPPSSGLDDCMKKKKRVKKESASKSKLSVPQVVTTPQTTNYSPAFPLTPITPGLTPVEQPFTDSERAEAEHSDNADESVIVHRLDTTFSVRHVSDAGESTISSLPSEITLQAVTPDIANSSDDITLPTSTRPRSGMRSGPKTELHSEGSHVRWHQNRDVSLVLRNACDDGTRGMNTSNNEFPPSVPRPGAGSGVIGSSENSGPTHRPSKQLPLVLLHVNILVPPMATYSDRALAIARVPLEIQANFRLLRDKLTEHVLMRGLLVAHPRDDYDLLEERILDTLELLPVSAGRVLNGQFWTPEELQGERKGTESGMCFHNQTPTADGADMQDGCEVCPPTNLSRPFSTPTVGGSYRWDVSVYAANGLMKCAAWQAAWREMESVDVEIAPWVSAEMRNDLEHARRMEEEEMEQNQRARITDGLETSVDMDVIDNSPRLVGSVNAVSEIATHQRGESESTLSGWTEGVNDSDTSATEVDSVISGSSYTGTGAAKRDQTRKSKRKGKNHSVTFLEVDQREDREGEKPYVSDDDSFADHQFDDHHRPSGSRAPEPKPLSVLLRQYVAFKIRDQRIHALLLGLFTIWLTLFFTGTAGVGISKSSEINPSSSLAVNSFTPSSIAPEGPGPIKPATLTLIGTLTETLTQTETWSTTSTVTHTATYLSVTTMTEIQTETATEQVTHTQTSISTVTETERYTTTHTRTQTKTQTHTHTQTQAPTETQTADYIASTGLPTSGIYHSFNPGSRGPVSGMGAGPYLLERQFLRGMCNVPEMSCIGFSACGAITVPGRGRRPERGQTLEHGPGPVSVEGTRGETEVGHAVSVSPVEFENALFPDAGSKSSVPWRKDVSI